jgi:hypothetical protein
VKTPMGSAWLTMPELFGEQWQAIVSTRPVSTG